ncbi:hypothetical protein J6590_085229 [Homalodisca vitripennis]|nr:hypothetical protein J6590_085229 [Homalodisca vitripennis]
MSVCTSSGHRAEPRGNGVVSVVTARLVVISTVVQCVVYKQWTPRCARGDGVFVQAVARRCATRWRSKFSGYCSFSRDQYHVVVCSVQAVDTALSGKVRGEVSGYCSSSRYLYRGAVCSVQAVDTALIRECSSSGYRAKPRGDVSSYYSSSRDLYRVVVCSVQAVDTALSGKVTEYCQWLLLV